MLRLMKGALILAILWHVIGWALHSLALGHGLAIWALVIGPLVLLPIIWLWLKTLGFLRRLDGDEHSQILTKLYLESVCQNPGPSLDIWLIEHSDKAMLWFQWPSRDQQTLIITSAWFHQSIDDARKDWQAIWQDILHTSPAQRYLRYWQISLWLGSASLLSLPVFLMRHLLDWLNLNPPIAFYFIFMRLGWWFRETILDEQDGSIHKPNVRHFSHTGDTPELWNSLLWGPWFQISEKYPHPLKWLWTNSKAYLQGS